MINFEEELKNFQPMPDLDDLPNDVDADAIYDVIKLLNTSGGQKPRPSGK